jgi:hypothetical protein
LCRSIVYAIINAKALSINALNVLADTQTGDLLPATGRYAICRQAARLNDIVKEKKL